MRIGAPAILLGLLTLAAQARAASAPDSPADDHAVLAPYDAIRGAYSPFMVAGDPLAWPMKAKVLSSSPYTYWRGSKDRFFAWSRTHAADWLDDRGAYLPTHGDLHFGNIGTYAASGPFGTMGFGLVDFDESAVLPFQLELLQGLITIELTARNHQLAWVQAERDDASRMLFDAYGRAIRTEASGMALLGEDPWVAALLARQGTPYADDMRRLLSPCGGFQRTICATALNGETTLKEILRPAADEIPQVAAALAAAMERSPSLLGRFNYADEASIRQNILDVALRTRLGSSGSQGQKKYVVLMRRPLRGVDEERVVIYLKQQIPSAAERAGAIGPQPGTPGLRCASLTTWLTESSPYINGWCEMGGASYAVMLKDPWSDELSPDAIRTAEDLVHAARVWGLSAGVAHRTAGGARQVLPRLTPALLRDLRERAAAYVDFAQADFDQFVHDPRTVADVQTARTAIGAFDAPR